MVRARLHGDHRKAVLSVKKRLCALFKASGGHWLDYRGRRGSDSGGAAHIRQQPVLSHHVDGASSASTYTCVRTSVVLFSYLAAVQ